MEWSLYFFEKVSSTNDMARNYPIFSVVVAKEQTNGRGRYGRIWSGMPGNLYMSVVLPDFQEKSPLLAFVVGVAVADALKAFGVRLKWPNDVCLSKKKLSGILLEHLGNRIVAGIGVNVADAPTENILYPTISLKGVLTAEEVCKMILERLSVWLTLFKINGFEPIRSAWLTFAEGLNKEIEVRLPRESIRGRFIAITSLGAIDLELPDMTHRQIMAGDVFLMSKRK